MACNLTFALLCIAIFSIFFLSIVSGDKKKEGKGKPDESEKWKKKDIRDYTEADLERLYDQWEEGDEDELEEDELPEWKRPGPKVDMSKIDLNDPEGMLKMTKKGKTLMMFATVSGNPDKEETEKITQLWQGSLFNANLEVQRYVVGENRVIFMVKDGSLAWDIKKFLIEQERCEEVTIDGQSYPGRAAKNKDSGKSVKDKDQQKTTKMQGKKKEGKKSGKEKKLKSKLDNRTDKKKDEL